MVFVVEIVLNFIKPPHPFLRQKDGNGPAALT